MCEFTYDFVHLTLYALGGKVSGKTNLQKTVYFVGIKSGLIDELGYRPHFYGPYSDEVARAAASLKALGFLDTQVMPWGVDGRGFEIARTDYSLTKDGREIAELKVKQQSELWEKVKESVNKFQAIGESNYVKLSIAAKTFFVIGDQNGPISVEDIRKCAGKFGWKVTEDEIKEAALFLEKLNLAKRKKKQAVAT